MALANLKTVLTFLFIYLVIFPAQAEDTNLSTNMSVDYGIWKPSSLDDFSTQPLKNVKGASYYHGLSFMAKLFPTHALRFSIFQWQQKDLKELDLQSVTIRHLSCNLFHIILPESQLSPYVNYGIAAIWSRETPTGANSRKVPLNRAGWGFDVGAGLNWRFHRHFAVSAEYQFLYAMFQDKVGRTDNYSGPKLSARILYIF